ncbi:MAG: divergent polysaccharide deacetylase family protein [Alphaproteobacteria bacterium]
MWKQIERSTPPRPLKRNVDREPPPPKGPAISSARTAKRKFLGVRRSSLALVGGLTLSVFAVGLVAGIGIGNVFVEQDRPAADVDMPQADDWQQEQVAEDGEYSLPVTVYRSERALQEYAYEEKPPEELPDEVFQDIPEIGLIDDTAPTQTEIPDIESPDIETTAIDIADIAPDEPAATNPSDEQQGPIPLIVDPAPDAETTPVEPDTQTASLPQSPRPEPEQLDRSPAIPLWRQNAVQIPVDYTRPMIAIVIDDVGINQPRSERAIALPGRLTLAFIPYGYNLPALVETARGNGHEVMVHLPTEPMSPDVDPGPHALLTSLSLAEIKQRIDWNLSQFDGFVGLNNHMGSRFTAWTPGMEVLIREVKARGLLFLDSITTRDSVGYKLARTVGLPNAVRDIFLDHDQRREAIARQLRRTEGVAKSRGFAIAIGHPHDETLDELEEWLETVESRGYQLVPISAIVRRNYPQG